MKNHDQSKQNSTISFGARLFILIMLASILSSCGVIVETLEPTAGATKEITPMVQHPATQELTLESPTEVATEMPTLTLTPEPTAISTPELTVTVNPDIETVDEELAERIKSLMPAMWVYNDVSKSFEARNSDEFTFLISKRTRLLISDKEGNEVGFARYFVKNSPDAQMTEYYSLTDMSMNTVMPLRLYSQMGDYGEPTLTTDGYISVQKCMYGFVHEVEEVMMDHEVAQMALDVTQKYASDIVFMREGDELIQAAILRTVANIKGVDESRLSQDIKNGISIELETKLGNWVVNKGIDYFWSDTDKMKYELNDGKLSLYSGRLNKFQVCDQFGLDIAFRRFLVDHFLTSFPDVVDIYMVCSQPYTGKYTKQSPVVVELRKD